VSDFDNFDDLDAVRDFRGLTVPFPGPVDAAVRRRILERAAARGYGRPSGAALPADPPVAGGGRGRGRATAVFELSTSSPVRARRYHRCMVAVSVALVVTLTAGVLVRRSASGESIQLGGPAAASGGVADAGLGMGVDGWRALAERQPDLPLAAGMFAYRKFERGLPGAVSVQGGPPETVLVRQIHQRWAAEGRPGKRVVVSGRPSGEAGDLTAAIPPTSETLRPAVAFEGRSYADVRDLPTDPGALVAHLTASVSTPAGEWDGLIPAALDGLAEPLVRPEVRAALVAVLAGRGLAPVGVITDRAGRPGSGFTLEDGPWAWTVVVDSTTGSVRGWDVRHRGAAVAEAYLVVLENDVVSEVQEP
jgi:hypothetical protein